MSTNKRPDVFSTHSAAKYCRVTPMTIIRWVEEGRIKAYKTPGGHRRIMRADLDDFCRTAGIPIDWHEGAGAGPKRVLVVDDDDDTVHAILDALLDAEGDDSFATFKIEHSNNAFDAGLKMRDLKPDIIFLDLDLTGTDPLQLIGSIRADDDFSGCRVVGIASEQTPANMPVDRVLHRPLVRGEVQQATGPMPIVKI